MNPGWAGTQSGLLNWQTTKKLATIPLQKWQMPKEIVTRLARPIDLRAVYPVPISRRLPSKSAQLGHFRVQAVEYIREKLPWIYAGDASDLWSTH